MKHKKGLLIGFLFGFLGTFFSTLGLSVKAVAFFAAFFLYPVRLIADQLFHFFPSFSQIGGLWLILIFAILNGFIYALIGGLIHRFLISGSSKGESFNT
ncbi:hypothetical protein KAR91_57195 [Candidatus Pacearchaeota archaeon]|nr:hypothetical protein [Candidatus Pacearchaeota archaeon]